MKSKVVFRCFKPQTVIVSLGRCSLPCSRILQPSGIKFPQADFGCGDSNQQLSPQQKACFGCSNRKGFEVSWSSSDSLIHSGQGPLLHIIPSFLPLISYCLFTVCTPSNKGQKSPEKNKEIKVKYSVCFKQICTVSGVKQLIKHTKSDRNRCVMPVTA